MQTRSIDLKTPDGVCDAYIAWPEDSGSYRAVLLYMDGFGPRESMFQMAQKIAARGYFVLLPNMFYRQRRAPLVEAHYPISKEDMPAAFKQIQPLLASYDPEKGMRDAQVFFDFLADQKTVKAGKIGITGYCMGGGLALRTAARYPDRVAVACSFHGGRLATDAPNSPHRLASELKARLYFAHADQDQTMPLNEIERLEEALKEAHVRFESELMPGAGHGFTQRDLPAYNEAADKKHWEKLFELLSAELN